MLEIYSLMMHDGASTNLVTSTPLAVSHLSNEAAELLYLPVAVEIMEKRR